ncbi:probable cyclic nucleotide-gated ion channel 14 [Macadamia integrifolia]|uniref:probable cyclic nucleotide-gated ion channel 14 n=1 Tax=Macadamia integrifolia TaxID=60698 RepID=UPI001C4F1FA6|nr:probable cyclic nucleotide-gated ion channel 14 [Macadamia integrifolia]XP_042515727.1 probable cyclic nucleotide-gated ion channel 14 [Macadamia integrifolia]XP_042515735.1 probable cyclic nucleotide-gated ion channel 14 [Macadamia integrifolia]XP_042515741.1 probable cyclic nucleotide-gated ion channel 14 [Macadamia integrifolia]
MELKKEKTVRFYPDEKQHSDVLWERTEPLHLRTPSPLYKISAPLLKSDGLKSDDHGLSHDGVLGGGGFRSKITGSFNLGRSKVFPEDDEPWRKKILDPGSDIVLRWNRIFLFSSLVALILDPLFFYLPLLVSDGSAPPGTATSTCMETDLNLGIVVTCFRTVADLFYLLHILIKFRTAYIAPISRVFGRGELVMDSKKIAKRYLRTDFFIDLAATLPLPQFVIWFIIPALKSSHTDHTNNALALIVLIQYVPRLYQIFPLSAEIIKANGVITKTAWAGAAYNLLLYMIASHVLGASWYLLSIERYTTCWKTECRNDINCSLSYLDCDSLQNNNRVVWANGTVVFANCDATNSNITFNYGMFTNAFTNYVVASKFLERYFYCLWWGLQVLSSYGQTLQTSTFIGETSFAILIVIVGLVLFAHLIGNMQTYLQSITARLEEWRLKRRDTEEWMRHRQLPPDLQERVRKFIQYKWLATRGVDEEAILCALPTDLRRDIQRHLCLDLVRRVPFFSQMDDQLLDAICERLVSSLSTEGTYIVREGDPVTEMLFIIRGRLESSTTNGGRTGFFNSITLRPGDFCGEELLAWALLPKSTVNLPSSTRTVRALTEVEAFALQAEDLKFVANQFRRLHSKKLQHTFRFYSHHWRTWAACFIQAAWRQYKRRKLGKDLSMQESLSFSYSSDVQEAVETGDKGEGSTAALVGPSTAVQNLAVTVLASRFAANTRRAGQKIKGVEIPIRKPEDPDFFTEADD